MNKSDIPALLERLGFPFAYDHFAEGEGPDPPFLVYRYPSADNFAADGVAYFKQDILHIEVYTDRKDPALEEQIEAALDEGGIFMAKARHGSTAKSCTRSFMKWRYLHEQHQ